MTGLESYHADIEHDRRKDNRILEAVEMQENEGIRGVCCEYCKKYKSNDCPVKTASPWSRWDYCNHFRDKNNKSIPEILKGSNL